MPLRRFPALRQWRPAPLARRWGRAIGTLGLILFLILIFGRLTVDEVVLDLRHQVADASITKIEPRRNVDFAVVSYVDASNIERTARIQLSWWPGDVEVGDRQRIDYDPSSPSRARRHGAHDPFALWPIAAGVGLAALLGVGRRRRSGRQRDRLLQGRKPKLEGLPVQEDNGFTEPHSKVRVSRRDEG